MGGTNFAFQKKIIEANKTMKDRKLKARYFSQRFSLGGVASLPAQAYPYWVACHVGEKKGPQRLRAFLIDDLDFTGCICRSSTPTKRLTGLAYGFDKGNG
ncbi:MAG TPA: hypothetical protein VN850_09560 [Candidatus Acidoferrales bacterium]|nr:hypothetical protein [Candidatus Acidoferrales bacterium]